MPTAPMRSFAPGMRDSESVINAAVFRNARRCSFVAAQKYARKENCRMRAEAAAVSWPKLALT